MRMGRVHSLWKHYLGVTIMRWSVVSKIRDLSARNQDRCLMRCAAPRNNTHRIRAGVSGVLAPNHVELVECVYQRVQEARSHSTIQSDGQAGRVSESVDRLIGSRVLFERGLPERDPASHWSAS